MMFLYHIAFVGVMAHCSCALCFKLGEAVELARGPKPHVDENTLMDWLNKETTAAMTPNAYEIVAKCRKLQQQNGNGIKLTSGKKWWRLFKGRQPDISSRTPQLCESQRVDTRLSKEQ